MLEMFERLLIAGIPFVTVVCLGLYVEQRWIGLPRRKLPASRPPAAALVRSRPNG